ncbi:Flp pilus assembly protein CpaB [Blastococcus saxobsidens]|uniref:Pilus assembly protein n=1 Tax=Blastococcus saxobsidens (strain DD2) TaxID=1146883 RepID=H6RRS9_BLASD|nr:RcpC/CpaB family pilus assembly protein [Blastococcus saxobsidens]CCG02923.1 pilus assembly protein [Blastococcus saxobsidens DD2]
MRRRLIAAFAALLLTGAGAVVLLAYVRGADARALAGTETVAVLVVRAPVPVGTPAEELGAMVATELIPAKAVAEGAVTDLDALTGRVATVDLQPGEQLLAGRFAERTDLRTPGTVPVPAGAGEVSVLLEPQRAVGGRLAAGDTVGVFVSLTQDTGGATHAVLHGVLVTQVQGAPAPVDPAAEGTPETASAGGAAPTGSVLVTLALPAAEAEAVVFGAEHGTLWLSLEPEGTDISGTEVITGTTIYGKAFA